MATRYRQKTTLPSNCRANYCIALNRNLRQGENLQGEIYAWALRRWGRMKKGGVDQEKCWGEERVARWQGCVTFANHRDWRRAECRPGSVTRAMARDPIQLIFLL
jgi:hypothetical protein